MESLCDPLLTHDIPEHFRDEYRTRYNVLYECPLYRLLIGSDIWPIEQQQF